MEMIKIKGYTEFCIDFIEQNIASYGGEEYSELMDLAQALTANINANGTYTFSTATAKEYIKEWFNEAGEYVEYELNNFGKQLHNPFLSPEAFHVCMIIYGVESLLSQCEEIEGFVLTDEVIASILEEIKGFNVEF